MCEATSDIVTGRFTPVATHCCAGYCHLFGEVDCYGIWVVWHQCTSSRGGRKGSTTIVLYHIPTFVAQTDRHIHLSEHPPTRTVSNCTLQSPKCSILERQDLVSTNLLLEISWSITKHYLFQDRIIFVSATLVLCGHFKRDFSEVFSVQLQPLPLAASSSTPASRSCSEVEIGKR